MKPLKTGEEYAVRVTCPACGESGLVPLDLASRVTLTEGERTRLTVRAKAPGLPHMCGQVTIETALQELEAKP